MVQKRVPMRMCAGCGEQKPKRELIRVVRNKEGEVSLDTTGKKPGRGVYLCPSAGCLKKAQKAKRLERALSAPIPEDVYETPVSYTHLGKVPSGTFFTGAPRSHKVGG